MKIRKYKNEDASSVSKIIVETLRTTNIKDYSEKYSENDVESFNLKI